MRRYINISLSLVFVLLLFASSSAARFANNKKDISLYDFGLTSAKNGVERYQVLYMAHQAANKSGVNVDYSGINTIEIEIPAKAVSIPLTQYNDFKGCVFVIKNISENFYLFDRKKEETSITIDKRLIDSGDFRSVDALKRGRSLLIIEDQNLWVDKRKGHSYGHVRKDVLLIENGLAKNKVTMPYNNAYSNPKCAYVTLGKEPLVVKNITIERDRSCSYLTHFTLISGIDDVKFTNISIHTPENKLVSDRCFHISHCTNISFDNVRIDGTYSQLDHSGYGIFLDNVWNFKASHLFGKGNWGVFGDNNVNTVKIEDSQINRFDIHCYGRDVSFKNVEFFDLYNQYSSVFGTITYDNCTFTNFEPVLNGGSYNSYVAHEVIFKDCVFNATPQKRFMIRMNNLNDAQNNRPELSEKCLPNVTVKNLTVNMIDGNKLFYIFYFKKASNHAQNIGYLTKVSIDGLSINSDKNTPVDMLLLSNVDIQTKNEVDFKMKDVIVNQNSNGVLTKAASSVVVLKTNMPIKGGKVAMKNVKNLKQ